MWIYCWNRTPGPTDKRHSFRSRLNMRFLLWLHSPTLCIARGTFCFFFSSPSNPPHPLSYSSIPPSPLLVVPFFLRFRAMTRPVRSVLLTRTRIDWEDEPWRGNNKARDHVYHTLLDTVSHHGPPWNRVSWSWFASLKDVRFGHTRYIFKLSLRRFAVSFGRVLAGWLFYLRKAFPIRNVSRHCSANSFYTRRVYCSSDALGIERMK